jgi:hypothetical protein
MSQPPRSESRVPKLGIVLLAYQLIASIGLNQIPPVTLAAIGLQVCIFLRNAAPFLGHWTLWPASFVCIEATAILDRHQFYRLLTAPLFHARYTPHMIVLQLFAECSATLRA